MSLIIVFCKETQVTSKSTLQGHKWIRFEHCLYLNSGYKVGPNEKCNLKRLNQIECVFLDRQSHCKLSQLFSYVALPKCKTATETYYTRYYAKKGMGKTYYSHFLSSSCDWNSTLTSSPMSWNGAQSLLSENCPDSRRKFIDC